MFTLQNHAITLNLQYLAVFHTEQLVHYDGKTDKLHNQNSKAPFRNKGGLLSVILNSKSSEMQTERCLGQCVGSANTV